nr:hypothetical protein [Tanacetum cinerariifolium]
MNTFSLIGLSTESNDTMNEYTPVGVASAVKEGIAPSVVDMTVEMEKLSSVEDTIVLGSFPPLSTPVITTAGNDPDKSSYANVIGKPSGKKLNIRTLFTPGGNGIDVVVPVDEDGLSSIANKLGTPLMLDSYPSDMGMKYWGRSSYTRVMIELRADVELKDNIIVVMPKIIREGHYIFNVRLDYERKPPRHVPKKPTASSSGNKKKGVEPTTEVSNSNPFEVLNSVNNDVELCTNGGATNLVNNGATLIGSSFMNVDNSSTSTTPIIDKIRNFEELLTSGKATLVDEAGNLLKKVEFPDDYDSEDEVASVDNYMARSMASKRVGHDLPQELQVICNNLDIRVRGDAICMSWKCLEMCDMVGKSRVFFDCSCLHLAAGKPVFFYNPIRLDFLKLPPFGSIKSCFLYNPVDTDFLKVAIDVVVVGIECTMNPKNANVKLRMEEIDMMVFYTAWRRVCKAIPLEDKTLDLRKKASLPTKNLLTLRATCHGEKILLYSLQLIVVTANDTYI